MIEIQSVYKSFRIPKSKNKEIREVDPREDGRWFHAVRNISFSVSPGRILGLLGPNGAGKTTLLRMLSTSVCPTQGFICIAALVL